MSDTLSTAFQTAVTAIQEQITTLAGAVTALDAKLTALQVPAGPVLTQAEVDTLQSIEAALQPIVTHVGLLATPAAPPPAA